jgi:hypothetical protein
LCLGAFAEAALPHTGISYRSEILQGLGPVFITSTAMATKNQELVGVGSTQKACLPNCMDDKLGDDKMWMRMRTPSPDYTVYRGREPPALPEDLLPYCGPSYESYLAEQPAMFMAPNYITYKPVLCFMAMSPTGSVGDLADMDTSASASASASASWDWSSGASDALEVESQEPDVFEACQPCGMEIMEITAENAPSPGSIGHPYTCAAACKYIKKPRGCKDGANCARCHICDFRNTKVKKEISADSVVVSTPSTPANAASGSSSRKQGRHWRNRKGMQNDASGRS